MQTAVATPAAEHPTLTALHETGKALQAHDAVIGEWKKENMATINGRSYFVSASVRSRPELEMQLRRLLRRREQIWQRHQELMKQWAAIKTGGVR